MRESLPDFFQHLSSRHAPRTAKTYAAVVTGFFAFVGGRGAPVIAPTRSDVEKFLGRARADGGRRSPSTKNQELAALRAFAKFAIRNPAWSATFTDDIPFAREAPRDPPVLSMFELRRLFAAAAHGEPTGERNRDLAILAVLGQAGLRVHELVALDVSQIDHASGTLVAVRGKGGTTHDMPLNVPTVRLLVAWFGTRGEIAKEGEPALFVSGRGTRLSIRSVQRLLVRLRAAIGTSKKITPHTLRHTTATLALTLGADLSTVGELLRHSDLNTTRRYLHLVDERRREAVRRLGTAIPAELLHDSETADETAPPEPPSNIRPLLEPLDVQHGLDDVPGTRRAA